MEFRADDDDDDVDDKEEGEEHEKMRGERGEESDGRKENPSLLLKATRGPSLRSRSAARPFGR